MKCTITITDKIAKKYNIKTQKDFELFCKSAVADKLFINQFEPEKGNHEKD